MKNIQKYRLYTQIICLILTIFSFFINFKITMLVIMCLTLLSGVFYCGWVCPFGLLQDLSSKLGKLLGIKKRKMPSSIQKIMIFSRYILLLLVLLVGTDLVFSIVSFDPRTNFEKLLLGNIGSIGTIIVICFFLLISLFFQRPFCNYFCYEGAKYGLISFLRPLTIKRNINTCINCKKCDKSCPMDIEISKCSNLRSPQCINCFQCITSCPIDGTLHYGKINMTKSEKKKYIGALTTLSILIGVFLVYNVFIGNTPFNLKTKQHTESTATETLPSNSEAKSSKNELSENVTSDIKNLGEASGVADGIYKGDGEGFRGIMTVAVTVQNQQIITVEVVAHNDDRKWFNRANDIIPDRIVENQSTDVDLVSGATYSSLGIKDAVNDALNKAK